MLGNAATASQITHTRATLDADVARVMEDLHPKLFRYARFRLERPEAEDATSAAMERMWRIRRSYRPQRGRLEPWLPRSASMPSAMRSRDATGDLPRSRSMTSISRISGLTLTSSPRSSTFAAHWHCSPPPMPS